MNTRNKKKGFTITELVIVIVVIAILAGVLIPTFASLIKKANQSADVQLTKNLNTALSMAEATDGAPEDFSDVLAALYDAGYVLANMNPTTEGCYLAWESETNQILLIELTDDEDKYKVLYNAKEDYGDPDDSWYFAVKDQATADIILAALPLVNTEMTIQDTSALNTEINADGDNTVYIDGSITTDDNNVIELDNANANTTIDLGSNKVIGGSTNTAIEAIPFVVKAGTMNLVNGVISSYGSFIDSDGEVMNSAIKATAGSTLNVEGTKFTFDDVVSTVALFSGAEGSLKDVSISAPAGNNAVNASHGATVKFENTNVECEYLAVWSTYGASVVIDGGNYHATKSNLLGVYNNNSSITVEDGVFNCDNPAKTFKFYNFTGSKIVLKGGTFNGVAFEDLNETTIRGMCNLADCANGVNVTQDAGAWVITVK